MSKLADKLMMCSAGAAAEKLYVEDVFSTWLYTGTGSAQTITNGIDLSGKGGLVWIKGRSGATGHRLIDTSRGVQYSLESNSTAAQTYEAYGLTDFGSDGFTVGSFLGMDADYGTNAATYASWTFRKQAKFFTVVTYTGNGSNRTISHDLGSVPGCIIVKRTDTTGNWIVYHRSLGATKNLLLESTNAENTSSLNWNDTSPTSSVFTVGTGTLVNASGGTYVAYLFAHDAGGFGDSGNDSVVKCGSYTNNSSQAVEVNLGWEPQLVLVKSASGGGDWIVADTMRGIAVTQSDTGGGTGPSLSANSTNAEDATGSAVKPTSTGFKIQYNVSASQNSAATTGTVTYIYIAIRRGPMKTPTDATKVFSLTTSSTSPYTTGFAVDTAIMRGRLSGWGMGHLFFDKLRGAAQTNTSGPTYRLDTTSTAAENTSSIAQYFFSWLNSTISFGNNSYNSPDGVSYFLRRSPGFFDVVAYTGTGANRTVSHNLGVVPELMIVKYRNDGASSDPGYPWTVYISTLGSGYYLQLNASNAQVANSSQWNGSPTSSVINLGTNGYTNFNGWTYIAYLFATCPGVSKVGSYTGTGTTKDIDCGFTAGARFVLIKRTDSTGDWYVWDTARGIISGNDPYLLLNSTAAEVTNTDFIDPLSSGFQISSTAPAAINANGGTFIYLAIA